MRNSQIYFASAFLFLLGACGDPFQDIVHEFYIEPGNVVQGSMVVAKVDAASIELVDANGNVAAKFDVTKYLTDDKTQPITFTLANEQDLKMGESYDIISNVQGRAKSKQNFALNGAQNVKVAIESREKAGSLKFEPGTKHTYTFSLGILQESLGGDGLKVRIALYLSKQTQSKRF